MLVNFPILSITQRKKRISLIFRAQEVKLDVEFEEEMEAGDFTKNKTH